uniref:BRMS1 like transcriptional repressor n=1 Tax=Labrus bergylta TaxID=56723 RepID=A0A3Q3G835_9LABR
LAAMPVHRDREKKESTAEEMEVEEQEQDASSSEEEDSDTSSEDCERRRMECLDEMTNLEKQFTDLKDQLYRERLSQVNSKLSEVEAGRAAEYLEPLAVLLENMQVRTKVAGIYRELCLESVKNKYECETQAACQHWESEKLLLFDTVQSELEEKIRRLEEDRHSIDITSGNDWTAIRKVCKSIHLIIFLYAKKVQIPGGISVCMWASFNSHVCVLSSRPLPRWVHTEGRSTLTALCSPSGRTETDPFSTAEEPPPHTHTHRGTCSNI